MSVAELLQRCLFDSHYDHSADPKCGNDREETDSNSGDPTRLPGGEPKAKGHNGKTKHGVPCSSSHEPHDSDVRSWTVKPVIRISAKRTRPRITCSGASTANPGARYASDEIPEAAPARRSAAGERERLRCPIPERVTAEELARRVARPDLPTHAH